MSISYPISHLNSHDLIGLLEEMNHLIAELKSISSQHFLPLSKKIKHYDQWVASNTDAKRSQEWSRIITALQYHDIIRQRLEHIEEIHTSCIHEFRQSSSLSPIEQTAYIRFLPKIVELNHVQLQATNEEFQRVAQELETLFVEWEQEADWTHSVTHHCARSAADFHATFTQASVKLNDLGTNMRVEYIAQELPLHLERIYTMESERTLFYQVFNLGDRQNSTIDSDNIDLF